jgi:hypothetical protein
MSDSVDEKSLKPPIFIIGSPRSGTTMLRLMLTCHHRICIPPEGGWLVQLYKKYSDVSFNEVTIRAFIDDLLSTPKIEGWNLNRTSLLEQFEKTPPANYAAVVSQIYLHYAERYGKVRWGDKNNFYLKHLNKLDSLFSNAFFIHIVRDGRDVACSYRELSQIKGQYAPSLPNNISKAAFDWRNNLEIIERSFRSISASRVLTVRYEDLVRDSEATLTMICAFLGEEFDEHMLSFADENRKGQLEPDVFMGWKALTKEPVTDTRVGRWKQEFTTEDTHIFEFIAKHMLENHGYGLSNSSSGSFLSLMLRLRVDSYRLSQEIRKIGHKVKRYRHFS